MQVSFDLTREDLIAYNLQHQQRSPSIRRQRRLTSTVLLVAGIAIIVIVLAYGRSSPSLSPLLMLAVAFLMLPIVLPTTYRRATIKLVGRLIDEGKNRALLGRREVTITPVDICAASELRSTTVRWKAVERIQQDADYLYIYFSALEAIIIPRRAFAGQADFEAFAAGIRKHWEAAEQAQ